MILHNLYLTTALKCVPPEDKPKSEELKTCFGYFRKEIQLLNEVNTIVALGKIAFDTCVNFYKINFVINNKFRFVHGKSYKLPDGKVLFGCYHPSPRNVNTKRINLKKMTNFFLMTKKFI